MPRKMNAKTLGLTAFALLIAPAAQAAPVKAPAASPAPPAAASKPPATPSPVADFDARNPASVMALMNLGGGKATLAGKDTDTVLLSVTSVAANFTVLFASCDAQGRACKAAQFDYSDDKPGPTFAQLNAFNQTSALCRTYEDKTSKPHVVYSTLLFADDPYEHFRTQVLAWTGCIGEFRNFLKDPSDYLASAP